MILHRRNRYESRFTIHPQAVPQIHKVIQRMAYGLDFRGGKVMDEFNKIAIILLLYMTVTTFGTIAWLCTLAG